MSAPLILRNRDFFLLWTSQVLSQAGNRMYQIAVAWWILSNITESSGTVLAVFMVLGSVPAIFLVKHIGSLIDRHSSKKVLLTSDTLGTLFAIILVLSYNSGVHIGFVLLSGLLFALFQGFIEPTLNKAVPELVDENDISDAVAFLSSTQTLANFAGAIIGALLIERIGIVGVTILNGASYLFSAFCDSVIRFKALKSDTSEGSGETADTVAGWRLLDSKPLVRKVLITFGCVNFFGTPILVILPIYTKFVLEASASTLGSLEACIWMGILCGTFLSRYLPLKSKTLLFTSFCLFGFGVFLTLPAVVIDTLVYGFSLFGAGFSLGAMNVRMISLFQEMILNKQKGRFFALLQALISFAIPIGYFAFAALSDLIEIRYLCVIQGVGVGLLAVFFLRFNKYQPVVEEYKLEKKRVEAK